MKRHVVNSRMLFALVAILCASAATLGTVIAQGPEWQFETIAKDAACSTTSLALDSQDQPHVSYYGSDLALHYIYSDGTSWHTVTVDSNSGVSASNALALDRSDHPHISYYDANNGDLKYAFYDGETWELQVVESSGNVGTETAIAVDAQAQPHIAYHDETSRALKYASYDGTSWHIEIIAPRGFSPALALDKAGYPHISFGTGGSLMYAHHDGTAWQVEPVDSGGMIGGFTSLALDTSDYPHISSCRFPSTVCDELEYARYDGTNWQTEVLTTVHGIQLTGQESSLALDSANRPHIVSRSMFNPYVWYDGTTWQAEAVSKVQSDLGFSITMDAADRPHISFVRCSRSTLLYAHRTTAAVLPAAGGELHFLYLWALALVLIVTGLLWRLRSERRLE